MNMLRIFYVLRTNKPKLLVKLLLQYRIKFNFLGWIIRNYMSQQILVGLSAVINGEDNLAPYSTDNPPSTQLGDIIVIFHAKDGEYVETHGLVPYEPMTESEALS